jgi:ABC-type nitrate/sulfonate/bicarbonate transport system permease component
LPSKTNRAFGIDVFEKTLFGAFHGFFVVAINVIGGLAQVDSDLITASRSMGASRGQIWRHVFVPAIVPPMVVRLRLAIGLTFLGVLVAELAVARAGLGFLLNRAADGGNVPRLFALILLIGVTAMAGNGVLSFYQRRLIHWQG